MMVFWMAYGLLVSLLLCGAALAAESGLRAYGWPSRFVWMAAIAGSAVLPTTGVLLPAWSPLPSGGGEGTLAGLIGELTLVGLGSGTSAGDPGVTAALEVPLLVMWLSASFGLLIYFGGSYVRLRASVARWPRVHWDGMAVHVVPALGPAVAGLLRGVVVMPAWAMRLEEERREMILAHEREHLRAGDHRLLAVARLILAALPWNLPLWWAFRRLRLAVELDCDRRVLRRGVGRSEYGDLLLEVGRRSSRTVAIPAMFSEQRSFLERRVLGMFNTSTSYRLPRFLAGATAALVLLAAACEAPAPAEGESGGSIEPSSQVAPAPEQGEIGAEPVFTPYTEGPDLTNREEALLAVEASYPRLLKDAGIGGTAHLYVFIDETGEVRNAKLSRSSGREALDAAALKAVRTFRFTPAKNRDQRVAVWVKIPVTYSVRAGAGS